MTKGKGLLPPEFSDLEPHIKWALATDAEMLQTRSDTPDEEIKVFYDAMLPRLEAIAAYIDKFPFDKMPEDAARLYHMARCMMEVANLVENGRSRFAFRFDIRRFIARHEAPVVRA